MAVSESVCEKVTFHVGDFQFIMPANQTPAEVDGETTDLISTDDGASIRLNEVNGMRFYATANGDISNVDEIGIIVAPKDIVKEYEKTGRKVMGKI